VTPSSRVHWHGRFGSCLAFTSTQWKDMAVQMVGLVKTWVRKRSKAPLPFSFEYMQYRSRETPSTSQPNNLILPPTQQSASLHSTTTNLPVPSPSQTFSATNPASLTTLSNPSAVLSFPPIQSINIS
jgi:hypothetical protein